MPYPKIEITLKYKCQGKPAAPVFVNNSRDAHTIIKNVCNKKEILWVEEMLMLCLSAQNKLHGWYKLASGIEDRTISSIGVIATIAVKCAANQIIFAHNHPSGLLTPSKEDIVTTDAMSKGLSVIGIEVLDHIIFSDREYLSMREAGYM